MKVLLLIPFVISYCCLSRLRTPVYYMLKLAQRKIYLLFSKLTKFFPALIRKFIKTVLKNFSAMPQILEVLVNFEKQPVS